MKRIARLGTEQFNIVEAPAGHAELTQILRQYLPPSTVALFARPKAVEAGIVEWYSELGGQPVPFNQLPAGEAARVKRLLDERLDSIRQLATRLEAQGADGQQQAALLRQAARYPDTSTLYSLNGQPVLTFWGYGLKQAEPVPGAMNVNNAASTSGATTGSEPPLAQPDQPVATEPQPKHRRWWPWWLLLALLVLLAALLWWLFCRDEGPVVPPEPAVAEQPAAPKAEEPTPEAPVEEPPPEPEPPPPPPPPPPPDPLDELAKQVSATKDCVALQKMLAKEKLLQGSDPKAVALKQQIAETIKRDCMKELIKEAKNLCPGERPKELAPELIIVFDASGSMDFSLDVTQQELDQLEQMSRDPLQVIGLLATGGLATIEQRLKREPKRITAARTATVAVVQKIPSDVSIGLVMIESCPSASSAGYYKPSERSNLLAKIQSIQPIQGTPLADGVARAGQMLDGVNKESVMLVVSDGAESCGQNPCAVAEQLARSKPYLKINVVDIMGTGAGNCLAKATGGRVFTARNVKELSVMTSQAAKDVLGPANCR